MGAVLGAWCVVLGGEKRNVSQDSRLYDEGGEMRGDEASLPRALVNAGEGEHGLSGINRVTKSRGVGLEEAKLGT